MCIYIYVCIYLYICIDIYVYIYIYTCMYIYIHIYTYTYNPCFIYSYLYIYIYIYIYMTQGWLWGWSCPSQAVQTAAPCARSHKVDKQKNILTHRPYFWTLAHEPLPHKVDEHRARSERVSKPAVLNLRITSQKCEAVSKRVRIEGSQTCVSLNSRLKSNKEEEEVTRQAGPP